MVKTVCIDFDGVIHSYTSGWKGDSEIPDPPVPGWDNALAGLKEKGYRIVVLTTRALTEAGKKAVEKWMEEHELPFDLVTATKVPAKVYIDDRVIRFAGDPGKMVEEVESFKTWQGRD